MEVQKLKFHRKRCNTCLYYELTNYVSNCKHPTKGRLLSVGGGYADYARYCKDWKKNKER